MLEDFLARLVDIQESHDLLKELKRERFPVVVWGAGSMSYSVRKILKNEGIEIAACWVDDCKGMEVVDGIPVMSLDAITRRYKSVNVVFGHSKYELADSVMQNQAIHKCFCLVNVCYGQWKHLSYDFVKDHIEDYFWTYRELEDDLSKESLICWLNCKLTEDFHYILPACREKNSYFTQPFFKIGTRESIADIGAYNGDTIREFLETNHSYRTIYAVEPEEKSFRELRNYVEEAGLKNVELYQCGCWNEDTVLNFREDEESSGVTEDEEKMKLAVYKLDHLLAGKPISIIKINFLNGVCETLEGAADIINEYSPKLIVTVGFDEWGLINVPKTIKKLNPNYKISLRFAAAMPARLILFAY